MTKVHFPKSIPGTISIYKQVRGKRKVIYYIVCKIEYFENNNDEHEMLFFCGIEDVFKDFFNYRKSSFCDFMKVYSFKSLNMLESFDYSFQCTKSSIENLLVCFCQVFPNFYKRASPILRVFMKSYFVHNIFEISQNLNVVASTHLINHIFHDEVSVRFWHFFPVLLDILP